MANAGWYLDPTGRFQQRYWDGSAWTPHVFGPEGQGVDELTGEPSSAEQVIADQPSDESAQQNQHQTGQQQTGQQQTGQQQAGQQQTEQQQTEQQQTEQQAPFDPYAARAAATASPGAHSKVPAYAQGAPGGLTFRELQPALATTALTPRGAGDGTAFGEPILVLSFGSLPATYEWWTPTGELVAVAHSLLPVDAPANGLGGVDQVSGHKIGSQYDIFDAQSRFLGRSSRLIAGLKHYMAVDDAQGVRIATLTSQKMFVTKLQMALEYPGRGPLGNFTAAERKANSITFTDTQNQPVTVVHNIGEWDAQRAVADLQQKNRLFTSLSDRIADKMWDAMTPDRERICCAVSFERPPTGAPYGLIALFSPLMMEQMLSLR